MVTNTCCYFFCSYTIAPGVVVKGAWYSLNTVFRKHCCYIFQAAGFEPNSMIMNQLLVANSKVFWYQIDLLRKMQEYGIHPTKHVIRTVEDNIAAAKDRLAYMVSENDCIDFYCDQ